MMWLRRLLSAGLLIKAKPHPPSATSEVSGGTPTPGRGLLLLITFPGHPVADTPRHRPLFGPWLRK